MILNSCIEYTIVYFHDFFFLGFGSMHCNVNSNIVNSSHNGTQAIDLYMVQIHAIHKFINDLNYANTCIHFIRFFNLTNNGTLRSHNAKIKIIHGWNMNFVKISYSRKFLEFVDARDFLSNLFAIGHELAGIHKFRNGIKHSKYLLRYY